VCLPAEKNLFDLERDRKGKERVEEEEEDSADRSLLRLGQFTLTEKRSAAGGRAERGAPEREGAPPSLVPAAVLPREPEESENAGRSLLGLDRIVRSPQWRAAVASHALPRQVDPPVSAPRPGAVPAPESDESEHAGRSLLGLDRIVRSSQWKVAVASHAPPTRVPPAPPVPRRVGSVPVGSPSRKDEEEAHDSALFDLERSEFALRSKPLPVPRDPVGQGRSATSVPAAGEPGAAVRGATPRDPLFARDLLFLREPLDVSEIEPPHFERELQPDTVKTIPVERAILLSLVAHILLLLLLLWVPMGSSTGHRGFLADLYPQPKPEDKIPIVFRSSPGPERENPKRSDLSDKTRRAGGGDRSRPKSDTPFVPPNRGVEGLAPGEGRTARAAPPPPPPAAAQPAEKTASGAAGEEAKPAPEGFRVPPPGAASSQSANPAAANLQQAIQDAARQIGSRGQGGAGFPNPDGGFVDSGPISFDTSWYDWGAYAEEMVRRIKLHWEIPELARLGWKGRLTVRFYILADGTVEGAQYLSHSGTPPFDFAAFNAIVKSSPFKPLPKDLLAQIPGKDREGITVTFFYNIRPEDERK
jgi:TonB family protein